MKGPRGFSLVEVVVALVLVELGLVAVAGLMVTAARLVGEAARTERSVVLAETVGDSLLSAGASVAGERREAGLRVWWTPVAGGLRLRVAPAGARHELLVDAFVPAEPAGGD